MLLGLPGDDLSGLGLIHPIHSDELDDDVAATHAGDDIPRGDLFFVEQFGEQLHDDTRLDDVAVDDRLAVDRTHRQLLDLRELLPVVDHGHFDVAAPEIDAYGLFFSAEAK